MKTINFIKNNSLGKRLVYSLQGRHFLLGVVTALIVSLGLTAATWSSNQFTLYGVHDGALDSSQLFVLNLETGDEAPLGSSLPDYDIEAMGIHPTTCNLYAISGGDGDGGFDGNFYSVDKTNGDLTLIGNTGAFDTNEIQAASFHSDGILWAAQQDIGLVTVDISNGNTTLVYEDSSNDWGGLAWDLAGDYLYGSDKNKLFVYDPSDDSVGLVCDNLPNPTEALEFRPDGMLIGGMHNSASLSLFEVDIDTCGISSSLYEIPYTDVESIVFELCENNQNQCDENQAPITGITPETLTINLGEQAAFSGTPSYDPDGDTLSFQWTIPELNFNSTNQNISFVPEEEGEFQVMLTASDECSQSSAQATLEVIELTFCELELTKEAFPAVVAPGDQIDYTISLKNNGDANCTGGGVELDENYSELTSFVTSDPNPWQGDNRWNFGTVEPGEEHIVNILVDVSEQAVDSDIITNEVCVWASELGDKTVKDNWICETVDTPVEEENECVNNSTPVPALSPENPTITLGETVEFTNLSTDTEGDAMTFTWAVNQLGILSTTTDFSFTPSEVGEYIVTLKAADQCSYEVIWTTVTVEPPAQCINNIAPVAVINPTDQNILVNDTVNFTAASSTDADGNPLTYTWYVDGVDGATGINYDFSTSVPELYTIKLVISDGCDSDEIETTVNVSDNELCLGHENPTPVITPENPTIILSNSVTFDSSDSYDIDLDEMTFEWFVDDVSASTEPSFFYNPSDEGFYDIKLTATDQCGNASVETLLTVTGGNGECVGNFLPIADAGDDLSVNINIDLTLDGSNSTDPNGDALTYTWEIPSIGFVSNDPVATVVFDTNEPEKHLATLTVSDGCGSSTDTVEINVHSGGGGGPSCISALPTAVAGSDISVNNGVAFTLDGTGSTDPENDELSYSWKIQAISFTANTATTSVTIDQAGKYIAELTVYDECSSDSDTLEIEVVTGGGPVCTENCEPEPPVCTENCGGGGGGGTPEPEPEPEPNPVVLGEATSTVQAFTKPEVSPRAGSNLPINQIAAGLLAGMVTTISAYFISRRKYALEA